MKKICFTAIVLLCTIQTYACDICGCSISNYNPFMFPHLVKSFVSFSYLQRHYRLSGNDGSFATQRVNTFLLSAQINAGKKLQFSLMAPFQLTSIKSTGSRKLLNGIGDISVLASYKIWNKLTKTSRQTLLIGGGVKLPTGKYHPVDSDKIQDQSFNVGSGSVDYVLNGSYKLGLHKWIINISSSYKYNTQNKDDFRFGDVFNTSMIAGKRLDIKKWAVMPYLLLNWEQQMQDANNHILQEKSGGHIITSGLGIDVNNKRFTAGVNYQCPVNQRLAKGLIVVKPGISAHVAVSF